ncbi:hypothetical protein [Myxococcus sp. SDU36]|uniref:hypothetical protein n=1 Tax=Myxococcus sp. SDU36 TaxID=2831967 RepID=UPI002543334B|nr:hypothetical protein [Myxococcus sp. SDU36]WIG94247.1 hypothetical protein KGD87_27385 [Myxococcus sp. SDU36]
MQGMMRLSALTTALCGVLVLGGCNIPADEASPASGTELESGEAAQELTLCGTTCPAGQHVTSQLCNPAACGSSCSGAYSYNQVTCAPNTETFSHCGSGCPSGWLVTDVGCSSACADFCNGIYLNQTTCTRGCDPRAGTYGRKTLYTSAESEYVYRSGWCGIGTVYPAMCHEGTYYYSQSLETRGCLRAGSNGTCQDPDAVWRVTCRSSVQCVYDCDGNCIQTHCS